MAWRRESEREGHKSVYGVFFLGACLWKCKQNDTPWITRMTASRCYASMPRWNYCSHPYLSCMASDWDGAGSHGASPEAPYQQNQRLGAWTLMHQTWILLQRKCEIWKMDQSQWIIELLLCNGGTGYVYDMSPFSSRRARGSRTKRRDAIVKEESADMVDRFNVRLNSSHIFTDF